MDSERMDTQLRFSIGIIACPPGFAFRQTNSHDTYRMLFWDGISPDECKKFSMTKWLPFCRIPL
jgi:hypothetical protein